MIYKSLCSQWFGGRRSKKEEEGGGKWGWLESCSKIEGLTSRKIPVLSSGEAGLGCTKNSVSFHFFVSLF